MSVHRLLSLSFTKWRRQIPYVICLGFVMASAVLEAQTLNVTISGIRGNKGRLCAVLFESHSDYLNENACLIYYVDKSNLSCDTCLVNIPFRPGTFGLTVLDDADGNGKMKYNFIGLPKEGFGFSNFYLTGFKKPSFDDFSFIVKENDLTRINVSMKYFYSIPAAYCFQGLAFFLSYGGICVSQ